MKSIKKLKN